MLKETIAVKVIEMGLHRGADFIEVFVEHQLTHTLKTLSGQIDSIDSGVDFGIGLRFLIQGKTLYGYTNRPDEETLLKICHEILVRQKEYSRLSHNQLTPSSIQEAHPCEQGLSENTHVKDKIDFLLQANNFASSASDKIIKTQGQFYQREQKIQIYNSEGLNVQDKRNYIRLSMTAIASNGQEQSTGNEKFGALSGFEITHQVSPKQIGEECARQALVNLCAKPCPSGHMPVVMGNGFGGVIFHEACGHLLETTSVAKKASVFYDKLNQPIASNCVTAIDDGTLTNEWGSSNIDDEGFATHKTILIDKGKLTSFLVDRVGAQKTGYERTGSGRRQSYRFAPTSRMTNTYIDRGQDTLEDMIRSVEKGIYAAKLGGGSVKPGTGEFNFAVTEGYYIERGKIIHPVKAASLISTGPKVLKEISMVGKDLKLGTGMCGSVSGSVPVTVGQPSLKVDDILVGGQG